MPIARLYNKYTKSKTQNKKSVSNIKYLTLFLKFLFNFLT